MVQKRTDKKNQKIVEMSKMNTTCPNLHNSDKAVFKGIFVSVNAYAKQRKKRKKEILNQQPKFPSYETRKNENKLNLKQLEERKIHRRGDKQIILKIEKIKPKVYSLQNSAINTIFETQFLIEELILQFPITRIICGPSSRWENMLALEP